MKESEEKGVVEETVFVFVFVFDLVFEMNFNSSSSSLGGVWVV